MSLLRKLATTAWLAVRIPGERRMPYRPRAALDALQARRVRETVRYAAANVPHYRELFPRLGVDPRDLQTAADLERLPVLEKAEVRRDPERFRATTPRGRNAIAFTTSGSTGAPLVVYHDRRSLLVNLTYRERERGVVQEALGRGLGYRILTVMEEGATADWLSQLYRESVLVPRRPALRPLQISDPIEDVVAAINEMRPDVLSTYGSYLELLFRTVEARGWKMYRPRLAMYGAEALSEAGRRLVEERFGIPVLAWYNAVECFKIGFSCAARRGYHLHADLCALRIVDDAGRGLPAGQPGGVVISNLVNRGTVLLNYRLGDVAVLDDAPCSCGRTLPLLTEVQGRLEDVVVLPDDRFVHPAAIWAVLDKTPGILRFQLVQHARDRFELRLTMADPATLPAAAAETSAGLRQLLGPVTITTTAVTDWGPEAPGKFRPVLSHCLPRR